MPINETFAEAWKLRFGKDAPLDLPELASFARHRSVRHYSDKPVPRELIEALLGCGASASTSSGLQLWSVVSVEDAELRKQVAHACADQLHVLHAPWFFAFIVDHYRIKSVAKQLGYGGEGLDYAEFYTMAVVDVTLVAERMACAAEALGLGLCYIGGLRNEPERIKELLHLPDGTFGVFGFCLGYPSEPLTEHVKPRLDLKANWFVDRYDTAVGLDDSRLEDYNARMASNFKSRGERHELTWSMRSARRTDNDHLTGREVLKEFLQSQGFNHR